MRLHRFDSCFHRQLSHWLLILLFLCSVAPSGNAKLIRINDKSCGYRFPNVRIINGLIAPRGKFPWLALLHVHFRAGVKRCAGAIITSYHVLTAAHCTMEGGYGRTIGMSVKYDLTDVRRGKMVPVARYYTHEHFGERSFFADIAVLELDAPVEFGPTVRTICLPPPMPPSALEYKIASVAGWGMTREGGPVVSTLRYTNQVILPSDECIWRLPPRIKLYPKVMLCAYKKGSDSCKGDSGAPLIVKNWKGAFEVVGLVSFGDGCGVEGRPGIYTNVSHFVPWIINAIHAGRDKYVELQ